MDVAPPWFTLTAEICSGETRRCAGGDAACREQAVNDGYVAVSNYTFCRLAEVHTVPRPGGAVLLLGMLVGVGVMMRRMRGRAGDRERRR